MLRDNDKKIKYPNQWITLGGRIEAGETPQQALKREMMEELELEVMEYTFFRYYNQPNHREYIYYTKIDLDPKVAPLHEGQKIAYFSREEILKMDLAYCDNEVMRDYFNWRSSL